MVRSEKFGTLIGRLVYKNKKSIISFMRSQGISISFNATANQVIEALFVAFKSKKFRDAFMSWTRGMSKGGSSNIGGSESYVSGNFDPMATQSGGFTPMDTQNGANLKGDRFSNTSGFSTMDTQSGGFTPIDTQSGADLEGGFSRVSGSFTTMSAQGMGKEFDAMSSQQGADLKSGGFSNASGTFSTMDTQSGGFTPMNTQNGADLKGEGFSNMTLPEGTTDYINDAVEYNQGQSGGGFFDGFDIGDALGILNTGIGAYSQSDTNKTNRDIANAQLENTRLQLEAMREKGEIDKAEFDRRMALANSTASGGGSKMALYIVGGVVLVGALGTAIYFATRKK
tara:strand:- start:233 stop:1252 length:1020 start_codon:yes stop_codon:yes gene_type:complete